MKDIFLYAQRVLLSFRDRANVHHKTIASPISWKQEEVKFIDEQGCEISMMPDMVTKVEVFKYAIT